MPGIDIPQLLNLIKADVMGWINSGIANAKLSGVVINYVPSTSTPTDVTLPNNIAYTNVSNAFNENQNIAKTFTDTTGQSLNALGVIAWSQPATNDTSGIKIGTWSTGASTSGGTVNHNSIWGAANYGIHYGSGTVTNNLYGLAARAENYAGAVATAIGVASQIKSSAAGTITDASAYTALSPFMVAGTIGTIIGVEIANQGTAGIGIAYGLNIAAQSGAATNYAIYTAGGDIQLNNTSTLTSGGGIATYEIYSPTPASNSSATFHGIAAVTIATGTKNFTGIVYGIEGVGRIDTSGTVTTAIGLNGRTNNNSASGVTTNAIQIHGQHSQTTGLTTNVYGLYADAVSYTAGTITSIAQIVAVAPGQGTNRTNLLLGTATIPSGTYSVYSAGTELNYFGGVVQFEAAHTMKQVSTPANPAANYNKLYFKSGNHLYMLDSSGTETQVDGGGGGTAHAILDGSTHSDSVAQTVSRGSLIYGNSTPKWDELTIGAAGSHVRSDGTDAAWSNIGVSLVTFKSADESVSNSTLQNDDHLVQAIGANETWLVEYFLYVGNVTTADDFKVTVDVPASPTGLRSSFELIGDTEQDINTTTSDAGSMTLSVSTDTVVFIKGNILLQNGSNAGNIQLQWAKNSGTISMTVSKYSWQRATRVA